jgi:UDP-N-acetylmuramate dehydrogenase
MEIFKDHPLKAFNTFGVDAKARYFAISSDENEIIALLKEYDFSIPMLIIGGGSNLLFTNDFEGLIVKLNNKGISVISEDDDHVFIEAQSGEIWDDFVQFCIRKKYYGAENLSLIPGNVGSSPIQNIGAYGVELKDIFHSCKAYNIKKKKVLTYLNKDCQFGYRDSIFKRSEKNNNLVLSVTYKLSKKPLFNIEYAALKNKLEDNGVKKVTLKSIRDAVCEIRNSKLPDPAKLGNAGSFFKNPVISIKDYKEIIKSEPSLTSFSCDEKHVKIAAGSLIEKCGWKGKRVGNSGVHKDQALILVNYGNATGKEIAELSEQIQNSVFEKYGIKLETEVNIIS